MSECSSVYLSNLDGSLVGVAALLLILVLIFFGVRQFLSAQAAAEARAKLERDEDEGFLSLDQPDADEFSDFSDSP